MTCIPIPYLVRLTYGGGGSEQAVYSLEEGVLERSTTDIDSGNDIEDTTNNNNTTTTAINVVLLAMIATTTTTTRARNKQKIRWKI